MIALPIEYEFNYVHALRGPEAKFYSPSFALNWVFCIALRYMQIFKTDEGKRSYSFYKFNVKADGRYWPVWHFTHPVACCAASN